MSLQVEKLEKNMAKLTIEVDAAKVTEAIKKAYDKNKGKMSVPGFRKGKVPQAMIEKMYGPEVFYNDAADELIEVGLRKELDDNKELEVVSRPDIDITQLEKGKPFIFTAKVALKPEVELGKYKGVKIDNLCQVAHNVEVGQNTVMAALAGIAGSAKIGAHCMIGGQSGVAGHVTVADDTVLAGQSGIIGNIRKRGTSLMGYPALEYGTYMRAYAKFKRSASEDA